MSNEVLIPNFFKVGCNGDKSIRKDDLGWSDSIKRDAQSDYPGENGAFPPTRNGCIHSLSMRERG